MSTKFFTTQDNFKTIIEKNVGNVKTMNQISTRWTNFVFDVQTDNANKHDKN